MTQIFHRFTPLKREMSEDGSLELLASTDDECRMGSWREVLQHGGDSVDTEAARALLINHNPDQIAGSISGMKADGREMTASAHVLADARLSSGVSVRDAIKSGALRGVSIGYTYAREDADWDESARKVTVRKWRLLEISLTPIPADAKAGVRSVPFDFDKPAAEAAKPMESRMSDPVQPETPAPQPQVPAVVPSTPNGDEAIRASMLQESREVAAMARSLKLDAADFAGMRKDAAKDAMIAKLATRDSSPAPERSVVSNFVDATDKARDAFTGALAHGVGFRGADMKAIQDGNPMLGRGIQDMLRRYALMVGERGAADWSRHDLAWYALGKPEMIAGRSANVTSGSFPNFVMLNAVSKLIVKGYEASAANAKHTKIISNNLVPDFKTFYIGGLSVGNLQQTVENAVFPELDKAEGVYSSATKMWGGTMSLSFQAVVNDDMGEFNRNLAMAGAIADKTIGKRVFQKLLMGTSTSDATSTWTNNTTSGCSPVWTTADTLAAARAKVNLGLIALMNKVGQDGNPLGTEGRFFVAGPTAGGYLSGLRSGVPGQTVGNAYADFPELIVTPWLESSALTGNSTTTFYALGDPAAVTGLLLTKLQGFESPQVMPYDAGATAALKWKIWLPFEADLASQSIAGTTRIAAAQQCTT